MAIPARTRTPTEVGFTDVRPMPTATPESRWKSTVDLLKDLGLNPFTATPSQEDDAARQLEERRRQQQQDLDRTERPRTWGAN